MTTDTDHIAATLLSRAHSPSTANTLFKEKIKQRPLLLRPSSPDPHQDARTQRRKARQAKELAQRRRPRRTKPLSAKEKRALCIYDIPKEQQKYSIYEPVHRLWCGYMREILGLKSISDDDGTSVHRNVTPALSGPVLASADYHGALIEVVRSRCVSRVGVQGIVVKDTKFTFEIVTRTNELKVIPKEHTVFQFKVPLRDTEDSTEEATLPEPLVFELHGSQFENRAPDRTNKKFKLHLDPDL